ncbi:MAG: hypothetical protein M1817_002897 [Caeruleum heppii]|nr:MAG: hypothetical protein M1817_002897 [Caeruleum heppii]
MARPGEAPKPPISFDAIIQADRQKRKNEALANEIFGRGRRASVPATTRGGRKQASTPSLASRVGVAKRSVSAVPKPKPNINGQWGHDLHVDNNPQASRVSQLPSRSNTTRLTRNHRLYAALQSDSALNGTSTVVNIRGAAQGLSIRGAAGPFAVMASNFAPGTTASDIQTAMEPHGGEIVSCRLITTHPTVMAEIVFTEKEGAENVIATFNNQLADSRLLHVYMKQGPPQLRSPPPKAPTAPRAPKDALISTRRGQTERERARQVEVEDGRYGFGGAEAGNGTGPGEERGLYSDRMMVDDRYR